MTIDYQRLRVEGVYKQNDQGDLMQRIKVPAGVLSAEQARKVADIADRFSNRMLHLTVRGSIELHWLRFEDLAQVQRMLASVGLTTRGACGGAVRGVSCSTTFADGFAVVQVMARKLHRHFAGNPHFEGLPKKFKIGVDAADRNSRHLIQDVGLVYRGSRDGEDCYDVWMAGGLGREPMAGFLFEEEVPERSLIPLIEAALRVHKSHTPVGKRLKHVRGSVGEEEFRALIAAERQTTPDLDLFDGYEKRLTSTADGPRERIEAVVFAGEIDTGIFRRLAAIADEFADGFLALTAEQNVAFFLADADRREDARAALAKAGFSGAEPHQQVVFRICPGSHECRMGLAPTREVAKQIIQAMDSESMTLTWAISGCANSCAQPQLAEVGILAVKSVKGEDGVRRPRFDLLRREGPGLGRPVCQRLDLEGLLAAVANPASLS